VRTSVRAASSLSKIRHVVIIFQENRSVDDLFNGFPGADTVRQGLNSKGDEVKLQPIALTAPWDLDHTHFGFLSEYQGGKLDGFDKDAGRCYAINVCPPSGLRAYGYVPRQQTAPYFAMATQYTFADKMFQTNEGPSFPAHQYIVSGTSSITNGSSLRAADNPVPGSFSTGGCDSLPGSLVALIDAAGNEHQSIFPCFDRISLMQELDEKALTWRYYQAQAGAGIWNAPDAIVAVRKSREFATDVVAPPSQILKDIPAGTLADVVWVTPEALWSDHARSNNGSGPSWVADIVNAIGKSSYWNDTAIFVSWDDWGGWYDHVVPPRYNSYELGFRVPLIVISPYAKTHYVSHVQHEFGSILKFTEKVFGLPSLHTTDERADDLTDCFDFSRSPTKFRPIPAPYPASYFLKQSPDRRSPDDDAADYAVLYSFGQNGKTADGRSPLAHVIALNGSEYGTTAYGGTTNAQCSVGCGTIYGLDGSGSERVLYRFRGGVDGANPQGALLVRGSTLFGTTAGGGSSNCAGGCGTVFRVAVDGKSETPLYRFAGGTDGASPLAGLLAVGKALYGTTEYGGRRTRLCSQGCGTVFSVDPGSGAERIIHAFAGAADGSLPAAGLTEVAGTLYGTTRYGGARSAFCATGCGTVFAIDVASGQERIVYRFRYGPNSSDGANPAARLLAANDTLYGTTYAGGSASHGTVFMLAISGKESVLHSFGCCNQTNDGSFPSAGLIADNGGFYGTTHAGGSGNHGTVFSITPSGSENVVYSFTGSPDGAGPAASLILFDDMLYGTTVDGGVQSEGTLFKVAP